MDRCGSGVGRLRVISTFFDCSLKERKYVQGKKLQNLTLYRKSLILIGISGRHTRGGENVTQLTP